MSLVTTSPAGVLEVRGADRVDLLQRLSTNDLRPLAEAGRVLATVFTTNHGKVVDWTDVIARADHLLLRTSPGRAAKLAALIGGFTIMEDVLCKDVSDAWQLVVAQDAPLDLPRPEAGRAIEHAGAIVTRGLAAYGPGRLEILATPERAATLIDAARARGLSTGDGRELELARLRAGVPSPAHEFKEEANPLELRLAASVSWNKGCYVGQEVIARLDSYSKVARFLIGFESDTRLEAPADDMRLRRGDKLLGKVTSVAATESGSLGLAVVKREFACAGEVELTAGSAAVRVRLVDRPFWTLQR